MASTIKPPKRKTRGKRKARPTIAAVAAEANVANATVSGVMNNRADCYASEETRKRVMAAAEKLGYRPNPMARALLGKSTATVGLIAPGLDVEVTSQKFMGFEQGARDSGNLTITCVTKNDPKLEDQAIRWLLDRYVDGIAVYTAEHGPHTELRRLVEEGFPVVTFDGEGRLDFQTDDVSVDCFAGGKLIGEHLIKIGRTDAVIISGRFRCHIVDEKIRGINQTFAEHNLPEPRCLNLALDEMATRHWHTDELCEVGEALKPMAGSFNALIGVGDLLAAAGMRACLDLGMTVPGDVAVVGYDGAPFASQLTIPLTTVYHDSEQIGRQAFDLLHQQLDDNLEASSTDAPFKRIVSEPKLIIRASSFLEK